MSGMLNKIGKEGKTSWDSFTYGIPMSPMFICILEQYKKQTVQQQWSLKTTSQTGDIGRRKARNLTQESPWTPKKLIDV